MRRSSLDTIDVGIDRELSSQFDAVKLVAGSIDDVERVSAAIEDGSLEAANNIAGSIQAIGAGIAEVTAVGANIDDVITVAGDLSNVDIVATNIANVNAVGSIAADVSVVASEIAAVVAVADVDNMADIKRVADDLNAIDDNMRADITIVAGDLSLGVDSNVVVVSQNIDDVGIVANGMADVTAVGSNINSVVVSSDNIGDIVVVATDLTMAGWSSLLDAGSIIDGVESEPTGISLIETVAANMTEVVLVGENIDDVITVAGSINAIETNAANIIDIQNAEENAASALSSANIASTKAGEASVSANTASTQAGIAITKADEAGISAANALASENKAEKWADETEDVEVEAGKYSAKHWALKAEEFSNGTAINIGYNNTTSGLIATNVQNALDEIVDEINTPVGTAGTYRSVTTDAQGRVTSGTNPTTVAGYGLTDVYTKTEVQTVLPKVGFDTTNVTAPSVGQMAWNIAENTVDLGLNGATLQIGQEQLVRVRNNTGSTIVNGTSVMATGTIGNSGRLTVAPANLTNTNAKMILGICTENIAAGADGFVTTFGKVRNLNTTGSQYSETWADGDVIYVKDLGNGALTKVVPSDTQLKMPIAIVINAHATNGTLFIRVNSIDENHAKSELALKADTTYVDGLIGDINSALDTINGEVI